MTLRQFIFIFLFIFLQNGLYGSDNEVIQTYYLHKAEVADDPGFSGDRQHGTAGETVRPLRVKAVNQFGTPVAGIPVIFEVIDYPAGGADFRIESRMVPTDSLGMAVTNFRLGSTGGEYQLLARVRSPGEENVQLFTLFVRDPDWLLFLVVGLVGGLALFLLGMEIMSGGLIRSAGDKMRSILSRLTENRIAGVGLGALATMIIQSSSATNVMLVSFVNARMMKFRQSLGVMLGAAIGTTITAQLIAFRLTDFSLVFVAAGFALQAFAKKEQYKHAGSAMLGFGILFFGMHIMSDAMYPLRSYDPFIQMLLRLEYPLLGILTGAVFTALIQSSSAFIGIMIILGMQGLISLEASIPLLFGANIGTAVTALIAGVRAGNEARKVALAVTLFKVFGVLLFVWWIKPFSLFIEGISPSFAQGSSHVAGMAEVIPRQIANAHTVYNVFVAFLILPFTGVLEKIVNYMMPDRTIPQNQAFRTMYLDEKILKTPALALNLAKQEVIRMSTMVHEMVCSVIPAFIAKDDSVLTDIAIVEENVNFLRDQINNYLLKISRSGIREERVNESFQILYTVKELELIADVVSGKIVNKARSWITSGYSFSDEGKTELEEFHVKTCKQLKRAIEVFSDVNIDKALEMKQKHKEYRNIAFEFEKMHYERLKQDNRNSVLTSKTHLELMAMMGNISSHATNIARILLQWENVPADVKKESFRS